MSVPKNMDCQPSRPKDANRQPECSKGAVQAAPEDSDRPKDSDIVQAVFKGPGKAERRKYWKNWWYYYKWYVVCAVIVLGITLDVLGSALGLWQKKPDFQVAYVGKSPLSEDAVSALEQTFVSIGGDFNGDGEIIVQINQYVSGISNADADAAYYEYADEVSLIGDISDCESYFFLTDDPVNLQRRFQILANADGSCPDDTDYSTEGKVIAWTLDEDGADLLPDEIYLGRRCFFTDDLTEHYEQCNELWNLIYDSYKETPK